MNLYKKFQEVNDKPDNCWPVGHKTYYSVDLPDNYTLMWAFDFVPELRVRLYYYHNQKLIQQESHIYYVE